MQTSDVERKVHNKWNTQGQRKKNVYNGILLLIIGCLLLADRTGVNFPEWVLSWPMLLIGIGIFSGLRHNFQRGPWLILILIGGIFLADRISDSFSARPYFWPIIFIAAGIYFIGGGKQFFRSKRSDSDEDTLSYQPPSNVSADYPSSDSNVYDFTARDSSEVIDITAIFSGVKKNVLSKNFRGGDVVAIMGGAEINLTKADIGTKAVIDIVTLFGGTKIIVPPDWDVQSNVVAIFGGVDDKRPPSSFTNLSKVIYLEGTCIFGGIEIRSF